MSAMWEVGPEASAAQLAATIARADQGAGFACVRIYSTPQPASISVPRTDTPQAEVVLLKPCADCGRCAGDVPARCGGHPGHVHGPAALG